MLVVNKADGELLNTALRTKGDYEGAVKWQGRGKQEVRGDWKVPVMLASAQEGTGVAEVWEEVCRFRDEMTRNGGLREKRRRQGKYWTEKFLAEMVRRRIERDKGMRQRKEKIDKALEDGTITPRMAATRLMTDVF